MIHISRQIKDKVRNLSEGDSTKAQTLIRNFIMEEHDYPGIRPLMLRTVNRFGRSNM